MGLGAANQRAIFQHSKGYTALKFIYDIGSCFAVKATAEFGVEITCRADELSAMTFAASLKALEAFCSPSAAITCREINVDFGQCDQIEPFNGLWATF